MVVEIRRGGDEPARGAQIRRLECAVAANAPRRAGRDHRRARRCADRPSTAECRFPARSRRANAATPPRCAVLRPLLRGRIRGFRCGAPRSVPRPGAAEEQLLLPAALVVEGQPDAVADAVGIERRAASMRRRPSCRRAPAARDTASARVWRPAVAGRRRRGRHHADQAARIGVPFVSAAVDEWRAREHHRRDVARVAGCSTAGSESARNSSSWRPLSDPAIVVVTASSDCCSLSRSTVSISRAYWQPAHGSASVVNASSSSLVRSRNPEIGPIFG